MLSRVTLPVFWTAMVYVATSPIPVTPSPLSVIETLLLTVSDGDPTIVTTTGVSVLSAETSSPDVVSAATLTTLTTLPLSTASWLITNVAWYVRVAPTARISGSPAVRVGPLLKLSAPLLLSVIVSTILTPVRVKSPVLVTVMV